MIELSTDFTFEAAHFLPFVEDGNPNKRMHGHSFKVEITVKGIPDECGLLIHFDLFKKICKSKVYDILDHQLLNDINGLQKPTLENISQWIWKKLENELPNLYRVTIMRETCHEKCVYQKS
jgi:6-pyruvoyltetrahydropterin/6-carboxytetrahydropterin synthase